MTQYQFSKSTLLVLLLIMVVETNAAKYTLAIEPTYPVEQGKQVYEPLRSWLSKKTGYEIELIIDNNYFLYWRNAQGSRNPDFTLDAPHVASYRSQKKNYTIIATTLETLSFHLIALDEPIDGESMQDMLIGKKIIMLPSPSLATINFKLWFTDLFSSPRKDVTALSWQEAVEIVFDGSAQAAIVPDWMFSLYPNFASLAESNKTPGPTFTASSNIPDEVVKTMQNAILALKDDEAAYDVLVELNTEGFKLPDTNEFQELINLLPGFSR